MGHGKADAYIRARCGHFASGDEKSGRRLRELTRARGGNVGHSVNSTRGDARLKRTTDRQKEAEEEGRRKKRMLGGENGDSHLVDVFLHPIVVTVAAVAPDVALVGDEPSVLRETGRG